MNIGYLPFGGQTVRHSPVNKNTRPNFSESFYITRDRAPDHPDIVSKKRLIGLNRWPEDMPEFRAATTAYYAAMEAMTTRLVPVFATALGLPPDYFAEAFAEPNCTIRLIHYPPHPTRKTTSSASRRIPTTTSSPSWRSRPCRGWRCAPKRASGSGRRRSPAPSSSIPARCWRAIRTTASARRRTGSSTATTSSRYAIPFFLGPNHDSLVAAVPTCTGPDNPPRYEPTTYGDFTERLLTLNFAHRRGEEGYSGLSISVCDRQL